MDAKLEAQRDREWESALAFRLETEQVGRPLVAFNTVGSTNDVAKQLAELHAPDGLTVVAREQEVGRGRRGRSWVSFPGQAVYLSIVLRPPWTAGEISWLGVLGGVAAASALHQIGVPGLSIKWPNDVLVRGRKLGGVLVEPRLGEDRMAFAVLGIGINVSQQSTDWPDELREIATSCAAEGVETQCDDVIRSVLHWVDTWYGTLLHGGHQTLLEEWSRWSGSDRLPVLD
ncbi:MAG TPA: biotin--[acetyl-CoA-carboxylase] ligase [Kiritimatiellia bacterium]|nr:biotin--[acetyl-CoA-carboxylase] ligase [Kiritimatiellia bacterium]